MQPKTQTERIQAFLDRSSIIAFLLVCALILLIPKTNNMQTFDNKALMKAGLQKKGFTVIDKDIFKGSEYAGTWDYTSPPRPGKEETTPVEVSLIRKFKED